MRATGTLLVTLAMAIGAIGLAVAAPVGLGGGEELASARLAAAGGAVTIANSREGQALFNAGTMRPGDGVTGTVQIANGGDVDGVFVVRLTHLADVRGVHGGALSDQVQLELLDVTDAGAPVGLYAGVPTRLGEVVLGRFAAGEVREYQVTATLPDNGDPGTFFGGDNRYQGASLSLRFQWEAGPVTVATPTPTPTPTATPTPLPTPTPTPTPTPSPAPEPTTPTEPTAPTSPTAPTTPTTPTTPVALADAVGLPAATSCVKAGRLTLRPKAPAGAKVLAATVTVNGRVKARLKGAKAAKPVTLRGLTKTTKLKITVKASDGRTYVAARTYKSCKR